MLLFFDSHFSFDIPVILKLNLVLLQERNYFYQNSVLSKMNMFRAVLISFVLLLIGLLANGQEASRDSLINLMRAKFEALPDSAKASISHFILIDFSKPSSQERMYLIDVEGDPVKRCLVSHGMGTGELMATQFSNVPGSHQSSLGFYLTAESYMGKHGPSIRLDGLEQGWNHLARERAIVIHAAEYVSPEFINQHGRLGRSHGCPAMANSDFDYLYQIVQSKKALLFIYHPQYITSSK